MTPFLFHDPLGVLCGVKPGVLCGPLARANGSSLTPSWKVQGRVGAVERGIISGGSGFSSATVVPLHLIVDVGLSSRSHQQSHQTETARQHILCEQGSLPHSCLLELRD